jgi:hypothetical protein
LEKRIEVLEEENRRYEDDLEIKSIALEEEKEKRKAQDELLQDLKGKIKHPEPPCDFGRKGQKWSYKVFGLACELLCIRLTAEQCQRVTEVFLRFFYPNKKVRVPLKKTFEKWRSMMERIVKFVNVKVPPHPPFPFILPVLPLNGASILPQAAQKMDVGHIGADESRKGGVSILGVMLRLVCGSKVQDVMLDCAILEDQKAETEFQGPPSACLP